MSTNAGLSPN